MTRPVRVSIVEDHAVLADALRVSLEQNGFEVVNIPVAQARNGPRELLLSVVKTGPRVVLLDLGLGPIGDGAALIHPLTVSGQRVVVLTATQDRVRWGECLAKGALTVVPKLAPLDAMVDAIRRADQGLVVLPPHEREVLIRLWQVHRTDADERRRWLARLTPREADVLDQLAHGKRVREVAENAFVTEATVRTQVKSILAKLGVSSQLAAVAMVHDVGWTASNDGFPASGQAEPSGGDNTGSDAQRHNHWRIARE